MKPMTDLIAPRPEGLYAPAANALIDPVAPAARAIITHGHADHARGGHGEVLATPETLAIMRARYGANFCKTERPLRYNEAVRFGALAISLHPAGHILGSAQIALEAGDRRVVVSGDYKRAPDPTCRPFEVVRCDLFVTEATFALPVFRFPPADAEIEKLLASCALFPQRAHLVGVYALGKAQRVIALLRRARWTKPIYLHGALASLVALYEAHGVELGDLRPALDAAKSELAGAIVLCPPSALQTPWARRFPDPINAFASGWMRVRARARQRGVELPLVISDHADWLDLQRTILDTGAREIWITHGQADALAYWCATQGIDAKALRLPGYGDEGEGETVDAAA